VSGFRAAFWAERHKARRSKIIWLLTAGLLMLPLVDTFMMYILIDPERAREMGLIAMKAQLTAGSADWPTFLLVLHLGTAVAGGILGAFVTAWVFGRELSDHTAKEWLATPTTRATVVGAKFVVVAGWMAGAALLLFWVGMLLAWRSAVPGFSPDQMWPACGRQLLIMMLTFMLMPFVALLASAGRGYLPALGWAFLTLALAQIFAQLGWGDWFPWAVPAVLADTSVPGGGALEGHSLAVVTLAFFAGLAATFAWWRNADHTR
jgi:ABC-2 type transport system permease protein